MVAPDGVGPMVLAALEFTLCLEVAQHSWRSLGPACFPRSRGPCLYDYYVCMYVCVQYACLNLAEHDEPLCGWWELNLDPPQDQECAIILQFMDGTSLKYTMYIHPVLLWTKTSFHLCFSACCFRESVCCKPGYGQGTVILLWCWCMKRLLFCSNNWCEFGFFKKKKKRYF